MAIRVGGIYIQLFVVGEMTVVLPSTNVHTSSRVGEPNPSAFECVSCGDKVFLYRRLSTHEVDSRDKLVLLCIGCSWVRVPDSNRPIRRVSSHVALWP